LQECCISHNILTNLDLDNNEVEESKSVALAHFDDRSANNVSSTRQHVESFMKFEHDTDIQIRLEVNARA